MAGALRETQWTAMGGRAHVVLIGGPAAAIGRARRRIGELERRWSRFVPTSDISVLNANRGRWVDVSDDTIVLIGCLLRARAFTGGRFDPFLVDHLSAAGYDRTFAELVDDPAAVIPRPSSLPPLDEAPIDVDTAAGRARLTSAHGLDPGGLGKGLAADLATHELLESGVEGAMVNLGGDLRVRGSAPEGGWRIAVEEPEDPDRALFTLDLTDGAVATSSRARRTWHAHGLVHNHLIDPTTGQAGDTGVLAVTVVAEDCWWAETMTKAAYFAGPERGPALLEAVGVHGTVIDDAGIRHDTPGFAGAVA